MERSIASLTFIGSISEAIVEAKRQKKLFVVYISGEDPQTRLDESTWADQKVAESLLKYCIFLHLPERSTDAVQFSAIYPQKSAPCITAIGYNGIQVWQSEGFVSTENLASSLEKAWLGLHIQESTAAFLVAALAAKDSDSSTSRASTAVAFEPGSSSASDTASPSVDKHVQSAEARTSVTAKTDFKHDVEGINKMGYEPSSNVTASERKIGDGGFSASSSEAMDQEHTRVKGEQDYGVTVTSSCSADIKSSAMEEDVSTDLCCEDLRVSESESTSRGGKKDVLDKSIPVEDMKADVLDPCLTVNRSHDVHLNIRLPHGASLQEKFELTSTLRLVKDHVDRKLETPIGSFDLAIPYPRKVFTEQDLSKSLSELELFDRQALIVVPHQRAMDQPRGGSSTRNTSNVSTDVDPSNQSGGYFSFVKRILGYINPFSFLGGGTSSSNSGDESRNSVWQYSPNATIQNNIVGSQSTDATSGNNSRTRLATTSRFGSNIHTLKHDEDDDRFDV
ncbi:UBX domain [Dillenia turbinata]|uniref:UBX domain n=1 Tax=Dillenia turbinata TaxID=194707 RepID=A0AAN8VAH7_9MAGN